MSGLTEANAMGSPSPPRLQPDRKLGGGTRKANARSRPQPTSAVAYGARIARHSIGLRCAGGATMADTALARIAAQPELDRVAKPLGEAVVAAYRNAGGVGSAVKNALHGVWLGHPLHPVLTDIPIGAWTTALALDAKAAASGDDSYTRAADFALALGLAGAVGSAVTGLTDWSETDGRAKRVGLLHGLLNVAATTLMATSYVLRRRDDRGTAQALAVAGISLATGAAYLGGDLVYGERVGVTHAVVDEPEMFTPVLPSTDLADGTMRRARSGDLDLL